jgi:serine/threonine-protein kinase RsbW
MQWSEKDIFGIHMATEEALMNAVKHGNEQDESKRVDVLLILNEDEFYARIEDQGDGFDPDEVPDPCEENNVDKTSGRGVLLIKKFVDEVVYNQSGNVIEFKKKRSED